jgi:hypothetical protein
LGTIFLAIGSFSLMFTRPVPVQLKRAPAFRVVVAVAGGRFAKSFPLETVSIRYFLHLLTNAPASLSDS